MPSSSPTTTRPNTSSASRARPAICRAGRSSGGNVFEAPRQRDYPLPPLTTDQSGVAVRRRRQEARLSPVLRRRVRSSREPYNGRPGCTYCGFCQAFGCHVGAKSSILVTKLPEADATGNFKLITGAMCHRVNSDNSGRATGVSYYGPDGSDNTIEAEIVVLSHLHLRQHAAPAAVEDGEIPERPRQFERPGGQAHHDPHRRRRCSPPSTIGYVNNLHGTERAEAHARRS